MSDHPLTITTDDPRSPEGSALIRALSDELAALYPSIDDEGAGDFRPEDVLVGRAAFVVGRAEGRAVACGALRPMAEGVCEIKRMFVVADRRGRGHARAVLAELERLAAAMGYSTARLETGSKQAEAVRLYEGAGYRRIAKYGIYVDNPWSICFEKALTPQDGAPASACL